MDLSKIKIDGLSEQETDDVRSILWAIMKIYEDTGFGSVHVDIKDGQIDLISSTQMLKPKLVRAKNQRQ